MIERLNAIEEKYNELNNELINPDNMSDIKRIQQLSKEASDLEETVMAYSAYKKVLQEIVDAKEMAKDPELRDMAKEELEILESDKVNLEAKLEVLLIPKDPNDGKNVIVEIRGAAGGDEANIFAGDLYRMYSRYAEKQGFKTEIIDVVEGTAGGFAQVEFVVKGANVYSKLKYESGSHRVQRVPETESQGRIQTSTATVLVMPEVEEVSIDINPNDLRIDVYCASGHGGQGVNTTPSAVRITHLPTNTVVTCQNERSQIQNREQAMKILKNKLYLLEMEKKEKELANIQGTYQNIEFGSQIRSYVMHPYSMVKDHRTNIETSNVKKVLDGDIDLFVEGYLKGGK